MRIYELSKQLDVSNKKILDLLPALGIVVKNHASSLTPDDVKKVIQQLKPEMLTAAKEPAAKEPAAKEPAAKEPTPSPVEKSAIAKSVVAPAVTADLQSAATAASAPATQSGAAAPQRVQPAEAPQGASPARGPHVHAMPQVKIIQDAPVGPAAPKPARPTGAARFGPRQPRPTGPRRRRRDPLPPPPKQVEEPKPDVPEIPTVIIREGVTVKEIAAKTKKPAGELIKQLMKMGVMVTLNQRLPLDAAELLGTELGFLVKREELFKAAELREAAKAGEGAADDLKPRPPVVTIMGHVDHGKTKLLDCIRKTNVVDGEAGGITQHVGAYTVDTPGGRVTFIDTPGHQAFTAMRARGVRVTDIVVLVVAADDGVMPQTEEAIHHAQAAGVPIIVAINKTDLPDINLDRIKQQLGEYNLVPEDWGGSTIMVPLSAKTGKNVEKLLEMILLQAEIMELKASVDTKQARAIVLEARLDKAQGPVATVLVQSGVLNIGDTVVCGCSSAKIRALLDSSGRRVESAGPSMPVVVVGFSDVPEVGDTLIETENERAARDIAEERARVKKDEAQQKNVRVKLEDLGAAIGETRELAVVVKADMQGSIQAIRDIVERLSTAQVRLKVIHGAVGGINDTDINLAAASNALVVGFNVRSIGQTESLAKRLGVEIRYYEIIYKLVEDIQAAMKGLLAPKRIETVIGHAEIREVFKVSKVGSVAGCYVRDGMIKRTAEIRLLRDGKIIHTGKLGSLKRFKDDVKEVTMNYECGLGIENYNDVKVGDMIEVYAVSEEEAVLTPAAG